MKSPSNTLKMILEELRDSKTQTPDGDAQQLITMGLETIGRMQVIVEDVLKYTRVVDQLGPFAEVDLSELTDNILSDLRADITDNNASIEVAELARVPGDQTQLRILFQNLIANAIKFHKPGESPKIKIQQFPSVDGETLDIEIQDNGIGIAAENHDRIFGLFKRLHLKDEFQGSGLGLAICKRVIVNHGGRITVDSAVGQGTKFTITLPLHLDALL